MPFKMPKIYNPFAGFSFTSSSCFTSGCFTSGCFTSGCFTSKNSDFYKIDQNYLKDGDDIKLKDTIPFTFPIVGGRVIKVYDGDTITIAAKLPFKDSPLFRLSVRLNGIDAPEIKSKNEDEKNAAKVCREVLAKLVLNKFIHLKNIQSEKYGRILADVYVDQLHINDWLIQERYAVKYDGGTKSSPASWLKYHNTGEM